MIPAGLRALALGVLLWSGLRGRRWPHARRRSRSARRRLPRPPAAASDGCRHRRARPTLGGALDRALATPAFARAQAALVVQSLASGETLYRRNGPTWLVPASTMKVLTAVAAAERLGWGFRFETRLVAMGPVVQGTLRGDLLVVGSGDPSITPRHGRRADAFDDWARALKAQGIRHLAGHVVGDDSAVEQPGWGIGWAWDDLVEGYGAAYAALQYREGEVAVTIGPGMTPGAPAVFYLSPSNHGLLVSNLAMTGRRGQRAGARRGAAARDALARRDRADAARRRADVDDHGRGQPDAVLRRRTARDAAQARHRGGRRRGRHRRPERPAAGRRGPGAAGRPVAAARRDRRRDAEVEPQRPRRGAADGARRVAAGGGARRAAGAARDAGQPRRRARGLHHPRWLRAVAQRLPVGRHAGRDADGGVAAAGPARSARGGAARRPAAAARWPAA